MSTNLKNFNTELMAASKRMKKIQIPLFIQMVSFEVFRRIVLRTPVDTGRARGNWQVEIDQAAQGTIEFEGTAEESTLEASNRAEAKFRTIKPFSVVHITNNVEYVYYLEYDKRSAQHPEGMVEITLAEMATWASKI